MKTINKILTSILLLTIMTSSIFAFGGGYGQGRAYGKNQGGQVTTIYDDTQVNHQLEISSLPYENLSVEETNGLLLMREEEKLARDVYLTLYDTWQLNIFSNIARSEQTHTDAIKLLLDKYDLEDPMSSNDRGVFENEELQSLYDTLVLSGEESLVEALKVGATIEDLDIKDLDLLLTQTDNQDITTIYNNLNKGSRNHLRSFIQQLNNNQGNYTPQFISVEEFNLITTGEMETGTQYNSDGTYQNNNNQMNRNSNGTYQNNNNQMNGNSNGAYQNNNNQMNMNSNGTYQNNNNQMNGNSNGAYQNNNIQNDDLSENIDNQQNKNLFQRFLSWFG